MKKLFLTITVALLAFAGSASANGSMITFRFDDGLTNQYDVALPILEKYNYPAVTYVFTDPLEEGNWDGYSDWDQVEELHNIYGWEIGGHTMSHPNLLALSDSELDMELGVSKDILNSHGLNVESFASPFGNFDNHVLSYIAKYYSNHGPAWPNEVNAFPFDDYHVAVHEIRNITTVAEVKGWIDSAKANDEWLVILAHGVVETEPTLYEVSASDFAEIVDYVNLSGVPVVTNKQALELAGSNLVPNPGFNGTSGWQGSLAIDSSNHGAFPGPQNSLKMEGGANSSVYTNFIGVSEDQSYVLKSYFNCQSVTGGAVDIYIDEYDANGNWLNWSWKTGAWSDFVGNRAVRYSPSAGVSKTIIWVKNQTNPGSLCYIDNVSLIATESNANNAPVLTNSFSPMTTNENQLLAPAYDLDNHFSDPDGDSLTYSAVSSDKIDVIINSDNSVDIIPGLDSAGTQVITFTASDGTNTASGEALITIEPFLSVPNIVPYPSFEVLNADGWSDGWTRNDILGATIDTGGNGADPNPKNSLKINNQNVDVWTKEMIEIDPAEEYLFKIYFNCPDFVSGGVDIFFDEYDQNGNWLNWSWKTGVWNDYTGYKSLKYSPADNVGNLLISIQTPAGTDLTCFIDGITLY